MAPKRTETRGCGKRGRFYVPKAFPFERIDLRFLLTMGIELLNYPSRQQKACVTWIWN